MSCVWEVEYVQLVRKLNEVLLTDPVVKSKHYWWNTDICSALIFIALLHLLFEIWKSEANKAFYFIEQFFKSSHVVHIVLVSLGKSVHNWRWVKWRECRLCKELVHVNIDATEDRCLHFYDRMNIIAYLVSSD